MKTPKLETDRLLLRPFKTDDAQEVFECWESDPVVSKYMLWTSHNDINKTKEWIHYEVGQIEKDDWYRFAFILKETGKLIGTGLIYYSHEEKSWNVGYNLGRRYWGKGYATEAMQEIIRFAKKELHITGIIGSHAKENIASENVLKKLGFIYEKDIPYECNNGTVMREGKLHRLSDYFETQE
jgi:[ribosomal protein S5]-alanine N-acetyltransferase